MIEPKSLCKYSEVLNKIDEYPVYRYGLEWLTNFIVRPHKNLGRPGAVCPFVLSAIKKDLLTFGVIRTTKHTKEEAVEKLSPIVDFFHKLEPIADPKMLIKCLVIFFPDIDPEKAHDFIDGGHSILKQYFVSNGLMIGEFHPLSSVTGRHNKDFYPMVSAVPTFVIRYMSTHDLDFLNSSKYNVETRIRYLQYYLKFVGDKLNSSHLEKPELILKELQRIKINGKTILDNHSVVESLSQSCKRQVDKHD